MKVIVIQLIGILLSGSLWGLVAPDEPNEATEWYNRMETGLKKWQDHQNSDEKIKHLGEYLRKFGRSVSSQSDPRWQSLFERAQSSLIEVPGHAQYFADEIERLIADPANLGSDFPERGWYLQETLSHLPSPESVRVLGSYLNDDRFAPIKGADNSGATGRSGLIATNALRWIGLRESEDVIRTEKGSRYSDLDDLRKMRAWWEEIKSGRRTFSFKGQNVEYRFKPDGTWETIAMTNPPDDGPRSNAAVRMPDRAARPAKQPLSPAASVTAPPPRNYWWLTGCVILVLVAIGFLIKRRQAS